MHRIEPLPPDAMYRIFIDLDGPDGNAFYLLGVADRWARQLSLDPEPILDEMRALDYDALVDVFVRHFGCFVALRREGEIFLPS